MIFDDKQREAVESPFSKVMVIAGPGAGKTTMLVGRVSYLLDSGVPENRILCLTFSKSMAESLVERVSLTGSDIEARTFHSFFLSLLKEDPLGFGLPENFSIDSSGDVVLGALERSNYEIPDGESLADLLKQREEQSFRSDINQEIIKSGKIDFSMMASLVVDRMENDFCFLSDLQDRFHSVLIDEYQDVNPVQQKFVDLMGMSCNLWIIGDDDQAIYEFRASAPSSLSDFEKTWSNCFVVRTGRNYRSYDPIVSQSLRLIAYNRNRFQKRIVASSQGGSSLARCYVDLESEVSSVLSAVGRLIKGGCDPFDICVLSRTNKVLEAFTKDLPEGVCSSTFHGSKGREWRYVFIVGMSQGHSPNSLSGIEEERRLAYVAFTRARLGMRVSYNTGNSRVSASACRSQFIDESGMSLFTGIDRDMFTSHFNIANSYTAPKSYSKQYGSSDAGLSLVNRELERPLRANLPWSMVDDLKLENMIANDVPIEKICDILERTRKEILRRCQKKHLSVKRAKLKDAS